MPYLLKFFSSRNPFINNKRKDKGLIIKGIANSSIRNLFEKRKYLKMRYTPLPVPANTGICNNKMVLISWGKKPTGVLIKSKDIIEKQRKFFNAFGDSLKIDKK